MSTSTETEVTVVGSSPSTPVSTAVVDEEFPVYLEQESAQEEEESQDLTPPTVKRSYSVKVMNAAKRSEYRIYNIRDGVELFTVVSLEQFIKLHFKEFRQSDDMCIGYIEPGHGWKGKQQWINADEDLGELYSTYSNVEKSILLWRYLPTKTVPRKSSVKEPPSKRARCAHNNASEANQVLETLREKHNGKYKPEQLHTWAQMVQIKKTYIIGHPPDFPFFRGRKSKGKPAEVTSPPASHQPTAYQASPGRKNRMRTECIEQLQKVGKLLEDGSISIEQHKQLQEAIMKDIYN